MDRTNHLLSTKIRAEKPGHSWWTFHQAISKDKFFQAITGRNYLDYRMFKMGYTTDPRVFSVEKDMRNLCPSHVSVLCSSGSRWKSFPRAPVVAIPPNLTGVHSFGLNWGSHGSEGGRVKVLIATERGKERSLQISPVKGVSWPSRSPWILLKQTWQGLPMVKNGEETKKISGDSKKNQWRNQKSTEIN